MAATTAETIGAVIGGAIALAFIVLQLLILKYLFDLEKIGCACAMDWRRSYAMFYLVVSVVLSLVFMFVNRRDFMGLRLIMGAMGILYVISVLQYVYRLKKEKCECSQSAYREIMYIVAILQAFVIALSVIVAIAGMIMLMALLRSTKGSGKPALSVRKVRK